MTPPAGATATPELRTIAFSRGDPAKPWGVASGLVNSEVVGEAMLRFPLDAGSVSISQLDTGIGAIEGTGVSAIDLIEGDVALCIWEGGAIRSIHFANALIPSVAARSGARARKDPLLELVRARKPDGTRVVRGAIIAAQSHSTHVASIGRLLAASATTVRIGEGMGELVRADLEACSAVLDYAQSGVAPKIDAQYELYFGLARVLDVAPAAPPPAG